MKRGTIFPIMLATLLVAGGAALAVTRQCPSGTTRADRCVGSAKTSASPGSDILVGTSEADYITALSITAARNRTRTRRTSEPATTSTPKGMNSASTRSETPPA